MADADVAQCAFVELADAIKLGSIAGVSPDEGDERDQHGFIPLKQVRGTSAVLMPVRRARQCRGSPQCSKG
jgi:hypothetical protein